MRNNNIIGTIFSTDQQEVKLIFDLYENSGVIHEQAMMKLKAYFLATKPAKVLEDYARHLAKQFVQYSKWQYEGKNGANSDNEKGYWRGMADCVAALLQDLKHKGLIAHSGVFNDNWPSNALVERRIKVFNFDVTYAYRPNDDIYTAHVPAEIIITAKVPENFNELLFTEQQSYLRELAIAELDEQITFDTPDAPEFEIEDVEFELEDVTNEE